MIDPIFGPFFWGKLLSTVGIWIHNIVAAIVTFELTGSALLVATVTTVQFVPQLLFAPLSGKLADRGDAAKQIVMGRLITGLGSASLALWIWLAGGVEGMSSVAPVVGASLVVGVGFVVGGPAMHSIVPSIIRPGEMAAATALNSIPMTVARAGGPALGAAVAASFGPAPAFAIAAAANVGYGLIVLALRLPSGSNDVAGADYLVRTAVRHVRADPVLKVLLVGIAAVGIAADPSVTLAPALAEHLGGGSRLVGWIASCSGIGAGVGFVVFAPLQRAAGLELLSGVGLALMAIGLAVAALSPAAAVVLLGFGISGVGMTFSMTSITTLIQNRSPDALRGRVMALWFLGFLGARPFGSGLSGLVADAVDVRVALAGTALVVAAAAYHTRPSRLMDH